MSFLKRGISDLALLGIRASGMGAGLIVTIAVGRTLGVGASGSIGLILQTSAFGSSLALLGLELAMMKHFASLAKDGVSAPREAVFTLYFGVAAIAAIIALTLGASWSGGSARLQNTIPAQLITYVMVAVVMQATVRFWAAFIQSQGAVIRAQALVTLPGPIGVVVALIVLQRPTLALIVLSILAGFAAALIVEAALVRGHLDNRRPASNVGAIDVIRSAAPLGAATLCINACDWLILFLAAQEFGAHEAGLLRAATQVVAPVGALYSTIALNRLPALAIAARDSSSVQMRALVRRTTLTAMLISGPIAIVLFAAPEPVLSLLGPGFESAASVTRLLLVGQIVAVITGPTGLALAMLGEGRLTFAFSALRLLFVAIAGPVAAASFGLTGLAAVIAFAISLHNLANLIGYIIVRRRKWSHDTTALAISHSGT